MRSVSLVLIFGAAIGLALLPAQQAPAPQKKAAPGSSLEERTGTTRVTWRTDSMGHMPETMMSKAIMEQVFAGIQFILGDLQADTTPSAKMQKKAGGGLPGPTWAGQEF